VTLIANALLDPCAESASSCRSAAAAKTQDRTSAVLRTAETRRSLSATEDEVGGSQSAILAAERRRSNYEPQKTLSTTALARRVTRR
jgi:hypothetical protein